MITVDGDIELITISEVSDLIGIQKSQVLKHRSRLNLPKNDRVILNAFYYKKTDILEWVKNTDIKELLRQIYYEEYKIRIEKEKVSGKKRKSLHWETLCEKFNIPLQLYVKFCTGRLYYENQ